MGICLSSDGEHKHRRVGESIKPNRATFEKLFSSSGPQLMEGEWEGVVEEGRCVDVWWMSWIGVGECEQTEKLSAKHFDRSSTVR